MDLATREDGGDLGWFPRSVVPPELEAAAFALQPGEVAVLGPSGDVYYVIQVVERETARRLSPEARVALELGAFDDWLAEQRARAVIERFVSK